MIPNAMPPFDFGLGETADALREQVQRFSADQVAPIAAELDKTDRFPRELWPKMGELGLHGITVEEEYGGSGLGYLEHVVAVEELSRASAVSPRPKSNGGMALGIMISCLLQTAAVRGSAGRQPTAPPGR